MFPINRVVALATPVFSALAAVTAVWLRKHFPGVPIPSSGELLGVELAAAAAAGTAALSWLKGHQAWEARVDQAEQYAKHLEAAAAKVDPEFAASMEAFVRAEGAKLEQRLTAKIPAAAAVSSLPSDAEEASAPAPTPVAAPAPTPPPLAPAAPAAEGTP
jgi:hypothetical protein